MESFWSGFQVVSAFLLAGGLLAWRLRGLLLAVPGPSWEKGLSFLCVCCVGLEHGITCAVCSWLWSSFEIFVLGMWHVFFFC